MFNLRSLMQEPDNERVPGRAIVQTRKLPNDTTQQTWVTGEDKTTLRVPRTVWSAIGYSSANLTLGTLLSLVFPFLSGAVGTVAMVGCGGYMGFLILRCVAVERWTSRVSMLSLFLAFCLPFWSVQTMAPAPLVEETATPELREVKNR